MPHPLIPEAYRGYRPAARQYNPRLIASWIEIDEVPAATVYCQIRPEKSYLDGHRMKKMSTG